MGKHLPGGPPADLVRGLDDGGEEGLDLVAAAECAARMGGQLAGHEDTKLDRKAPLTVVGSEAAAVVKVMARYKPDNQLLASAANQHQPTRLLSHACQRV